MRLTRMVLSWWAAKCDLRTERSESLEQNLEQSTCQTALLTVYRLRRRNSKQLKAQRHETKKKLHRAIKCRKTAAANFFHSTHLSRLKGHTHTRDFVLLSPYERRAYQKSDFTYLSLILYHTMTSPKLNLVWVMSRLFSSMNSIFHDHRRFGEFYLKMKWSESRTMI